MINITEFTQEINQRHMTTKTVSSHRGRGIELGFTANGSPLTALFLYCPNSNLIRYELSSRSPVDPDNYLITKDLLSNISRWKHNRWWIMLDTGFFVLQASYSAGNARILAETVVAYLGKMGQEFIQVEPIIDDVAHSLMTVEDAKKHLKTLGLVK